MTDINRWLNRCLQQLEINVEADPVIADEACNALACFADDQEWLEWSVFNSEWYLDDNDNALNLTSKEIALSQIPPDEVIKILQASPEEQQALEGSPSDVCKTHNIEYGKPLPYWFVEFYKATYASCTEESYLTWIDWAKKPHFALPDGDYSAIDHFEFQHSSPEEIIDKLVAIGHIKKPRNDKRTLFLWIIKACREIPASDRSAYQLYYRLLEEVAACSDSDPHAPLSAFEVKEDKGTQYLDLSGPKSTYKLKTFENDLAKLRIKSQS